MKKWLISKGILDWRALGIKQCEINDIRGKDITFLDNGRRLLFKSAEIETFLNQKCRCEEYKRRIALLEAQVRLNETDQPEDVLILDYVKANYIVTTKRLLSRKVLRTELDAHLHSYSLCVSDRGWANLLKYLGDNSKQYRKLKLKVKD